MSDLTATTISSPSRPKRKLLLINGPNLNLLGTREPHIYGSTTLSEVVSTIVSRGKELNIEVVPFQSNHEGMIVDFIQSHFVSSRPATSPRTRVGVIINPAAFTHTSVAIRDALLATSLPFVECHVSNIHAREPWRSHSYFSDKAVGVIMGLGVYGYTAALEFWAQRWDGEEREEGGRG
ncbi:uncharacterized protein Z520_04018 [Fonsecaea multimorphosa CBS 102226]|uniref:Catabolic 3-dehydroquinase n=1 Tax=Fonsecaea multimorphosa CBS 102226 TaxID=1442371 RepID=A0A0D2K3E9_9EURO|nr:uncharacterized protein Z520_04018 [Fonsecaea multimorphosa CBS 102226]KIY00333.1 hypothetical protein Z520_04018 [Fonsecaea multimorphosa CBS 102226]OAL27165.1 hypothetical protein AYO22_03796 [Fonsecaea multimorphosa]